MNIYVDVISGKPAKDNDVTVFAFYWNIYLRVQLMIM